MIKVVVCNSQYTGWASSAYSKVRAATPYGYKKFWSKDVIGDYPCTEILYQKYRKSYCLLSWSGPADQFLIFKLTAESGLVQASIDIDDEISNPDWCNLLDCNMVRHVHLRDRYEKRFPENEITKVIRTDSVSLGTAMMKLISPIEDKLK